MPEQNGPWLIQSRSKRYQNDFFELFEDRVVRPTGEPDIYATLTMRSGAAVAAIDNDGHVYLARQFRYALGRDTTEISIGVIEDGEEPLAAARRELHEELGLEAGEWTSLGQLEMDGSIIRCTVHLFVARQLRQTSPDQDDTEDIRRLKVPLDTAVRMVMDSEITHAASCALILKAARYLGPV